MPLCNGLAHSPLDGLTLTLNPRLMNVLLVSGRLPGVHDATRDARAALPRPPRLSAMGPYLGPARRLRPLCRGRAHRVQIQEY